MITNKSSDIRQTTQRTKILEYLHKSKDHPTAEQVYKAVKKDLPSISLATVYRNLHFLEGQGQIIHLTVGNESRFDGQTCNHIHFICKKCQKIFDIHKPEVFQNINRQTKNQNIKPECVKIIIEGKCKKCQK